MLEKRLGRGFIGYWECGGQSAVAKKGDSDDIVRNEGIASRTD